MRRGWYFLQAMTGEYGWRIQSHLIQRTVYPVVAGWLR